MPKGFPTAAGKELSATVQLRVWEIATMALNFCQLLKNIYVYISYIVVIYIVRHCNRMCHSYIL